MDHRMVFKHSYRLVGHQRGQLSKWVPEGHPDLSDPQGPQPGWDGSTWGRDLPELYQQASSGLWGYSPTEFRWTCPQDAYQELVQERVRIGLMVLQDLQVDMMERIQHTRDQRVWVQVLTRELADGST